MKSVLNFVLFSIFIFEILSPFLIVYLNASTTKTTYVIKTEKTEQTSKSAIAKQEIADMELFDESFCDSKSIKFKEMTGVEK
jgi:hypothetical protein